MIVVAGEALVDLTPVDVNGATGYLPHPGGSPYNVAVGLGRLRVPVTFLGRVSDDPFGRLLLAHLADSGVGLDNVTVASEPSTLAFVHAHSGEPEYSFYAQGTADRGLLPEHLPALPADAALHVGSISLVLEPSATTLEALVHREARHRLISLDPNIRPGLIEDPAAYRRRLAGWLHEVDVVKVSGADLDWLHPGADPAEVAARWLRDGLALVLFTFGEDGALAVTPRASARATAPSVSVVDTVGAGDAFTAGALTALYQQGALSREAVAALTEEDLMRLLLSANEVAAETCTRAGADPPRR